MLEHRFVELVSEPARFTDLVARAVAPEPAAFLPCPVACFGAAQAMQIQEIYRLAAERTREQLQPRCPFRIPAFSRN